MEKRTDATRASRQDLQRRLAPKPNPKPPPKKSRGGRIVRALVGFLIVVFVMFVGIGCGFLTASMNTKDHLVEDIRPPASSHIYDINGNEIANVHAAENREPVKLSQIPQNLQNAFVAVEDNRFYEHMGIDPRGILRAVYANVTGRMISEGGSTITQQLAKNAYLTQDRTIKRKIQEVFLALQIERQYTKQEILELYLNQIYFGQGAYGVQAAAQTYFGKNVEELDLNECAMLAGIPKSPNYYSPFNNFNAAQERKGIVLDQMEKYGYINHASARKASEEKPKLVNHKQEKDSTGAYFIDYITQKVIDKYGADAIYKEGLKIYTTIDMTMQKAAEEAAHELPVQRTDGNGIQQPQMALVAIDPHTGYIKAMVGGRGTDQFNRATMAERQPGSSFKPFVFAAALEENYSPDTIIDDSPIKIGDWSPKNYSGNYSGKVTLRTVARYSLNVPTVKIAQKLGIEKPIYYAQEMGITTFVLDGERSDRNFATALGGLTKGVTPLEMTSAYGTFANKGIHVEPVAIVKILDRNGKVLEQAELKQKSVIKESSAASLTSMLQDVVQHGTGTHANIGRPAAGKTGTTDNYHDAWFVGYTPDLVAGVWVGNDDNTSLGMMTGGMAPAEIWKAFMQKVVAGTPAKNFDGVSYTPGNVSEIKDEKAVKEEKASDKKEKNAKDAKGTAPSNAGGKASSTDSSAKQPASVPTQQPSPPAADGGPEPGGSVSKGRD
ncbi:transglycosylase domain-containing protein [Selenomonas sp.]|uniref:transglycosylase domain-containing protein n=1 Tax=Selenomonas sp. TaxID=2053611 RepID=UPI003FA1C032